MSTNPPAEDQDQPSATLFAPGDNDDLLAQIGEITMMNERAVAYAFFSFLTRDEGPDEAGLLGLVTPESRDTWGDFQELAEAVAPLGLQTGGSRAVGSEDVHYFLLLADTPHDLSEVTAETVMFGRMVITVQRRPDLLGEWRVHQVGDYVKPEDLPSTTT